MLWWFALAGYLVVALLTAKLFMRMLLEMEREKWPHQEQDAEGLVLHAVLALVLGAIWPITYLVMRFILWATPREIKR